MKSRLLNLIKSHRLILIITLFAAFLRLFRMIDIPPSLNWDEVSHGYNAFSILKTGTDEWGNVFPTIFRAYGDYKLPVYIYTVAIFETVFGMNEVSVRLPSALGGVLIVIFSYLITKKLLGKRTAIIASFLVAVEPWSLFLSRGAFEANLALTFFLMAVYTFLIGLERPKFIALSVFFFGINIWTYNSFRIFTPIFIALLFLFSKEKLVKLWRKNRQEILSAAFILLMFVVPMILQMFFNQGTERYGWVGIVDEGFINRINIARISSGLNPNLTVLLHNKVTYFIFGFISNWVSHYSGSFLFFSGGSHYQFSVPGHGLLYSVNIMFLVLGVYFLIKRRDLSTAIILSWFYLASIPSSITREAPHVLRAITILPTPMIITSYGVIQSIDILGSKIKLLGDKKGYLSLIYVLIIIPFLWSYFREYSTNYRKNYSWAWQYGYKQAVEYIKNNYHEYDKFIITKKYGEPHEFILFYLQWNPSEYIADENLMRFYQTKWYWVDSFDKFYFVNDWDIQNNDKGLFQLESGKTAECVISKCLLVTSKENAPKNWKKVKSIDFLNGETAFEMYSNIVSYALK